MLASRRQSLQLPYDNPPYLTIDHNPSRPTSRPSFFDNISHTTATPSPSDFNTRPSNNYFPPSPDYSVSGVQLPTSDQHMSSTFDFANPAIRVQQSSPTPHLPFGYSAQPLQGDVQQRSNWLYTEDKRSMMANSMQQALSSRNRHQRIPSSSSAGSRSPASPYSQGHAPQLAYPSGAQSLRSIKSDFTHGADEASRSYSHHLPTPTQTPTQDTLYSAPQANFNSTGFDSLNNANAMAAHMAMKQVFGDNSSVGGDEAPGFTHSARQSVSSFGRNSPATPRTVNGDDFNEDLKVPSNDTMARTTTVPKFERTNTDMYSDTGYDPTPQASLQKPAAKGNQLLSPFHNTVFEQRLAQANQARSLSPSVNSTSRGVSPFRESSLYQDGTNTGRLRNVAPQNAQAQNTAIPPLNAQESEPKTISPKDAMLEYNETEEDSNMPLFPDGGNFDTYSQSDSSNVADGNFGSYTVGGATGNSGWSGQSTAAYSQPITRTAPAPSQQSSFNFAPASVPGIFHGLPNSSSNYAPTSMPVLSTEETPEFPAHLTSMESSASEAPPQSSANSTNYTETPARPTSTLADTGTYTCTYHGCAQRFETPQKLQRHKREAHRQSTSAPTPPAVHGIGSGMTSAALAARNSQAGPHKCDRINPTTGKPCSTVFSRPYDLTRHEDTIHNVRKQKVRCALCQEEKTFSRNDALTRHMRVVHPEVDFPGKHRKRGGRDD